MKKYISITQWIKNFDAGKYETSDRLFQINAGWYDWFCSDSSLKNKTYKLAPKIKKIANILGKEFCKNHYLFFKNNCPMEGILYDDFRFCDLKEGDVIYTICPKSGHKSEHGLGFVYGKENDFQGALFEGTWKEIVNWFTVKNKN